VIDTTLKDPSTSRPHTQALRNIVVGVQFLRRIHLAARVCSGDQEIRIVKSSIAETITKFELWRYVVGDEMLVIDIDTFSEIICDTLVVDNVACDRGTRLG
jgi:hypothetical protein